MNTHILKEEIEQITKNSRIVEFKDKIYGFLGRKIVLEFQSKNLETSTKC